ncbi:MAG: NUDIX hydrolase [Proteobacteria bacterium]|nr:NUDIX hydrolase [Pseudomonadota bacterium]
MNVKNQKIYGGKVLDIHLEKATLPNGKEVDLEIIRHPGGAAALPFYDNGDVLMIRQFRHATGGIIWEIPAGRIDDGEDPQNCAYRELQEEGGVIAGTMEKLGEFFSTPGFCTEVIHLYLAKDLTVCRQELEADEYLQVERLPFSVALEKVYSGEIMDSKTMLALLLASKTIL